MTLVTWKMISTSRQESTPPHPAQPTTLLVPGHHCKQFFQPVPTQLSHSPFLMQQHTCVLTLFPPSSVNKSAPLQQQPFPPCPNPAQTTTQLSPFQQSIPSYLHPAQQVFPLIHPIAAIPNSASLPLLSKQFYTLPNSTIYHC